MTPPLKLGQLLHDRYLIQLNLGQGRLSCNFLANDTHRFDEPCLVKVFSPSLEPSISRETALRLFQRQAKTLYALNHPQIANFREFFQLGNADKSQVYLVQDFVEGQTYQDLLSVRKGKNQTFSEPEVQRLLLQLLPALIYLHDLGVFHRQLTPANIVCRDLDALPMLVEFSDAPPGVDDDLGELAETSFAAAVDQDLFALGISSLTLLSGHVPPLKKLERREWQGRLNRLPLSQGFREFLLNLLLRPPETGFISAATALAALEALPPNPVIAILDSTPEPTAPVSLPAPQFVEPDHPLESDIEPSPTPPLDQETTATTDDPIAAPSEPANPSVKSRAAAPFSTVPLLKLMFKSQGVSRVLKKGLLLLVLMAIALGVGWGSGKLWWQWRTQTALKMAQNAPKPPKTPLELKNDLRTRRLNLGLSPQTFQALTNDWLGFKLNQPPADPPDPTAPPPGTETEQLNTEIALLTPLESLSPEALNLLESPTAGDRRRWIPRVNQLRLSSRSFYELVNARFRYYFPDLNPDDLGDRPLENLWNAFAYDTLTSLEDGSHYQRVNLAEEPTISLSGQFDPGRGNAYAINIPQGQFLEFKLTAPASARVSLYSPSGQEKLLENSPDRQWSGPLKETGYYELVITGDSKEPVSFQAQLQVR